MSQGLPEGFQLDPAPNQAGGLPPGFVVDQAPAAPAGEPPPGFVVDQAPAPSAGELPQGFVMDRPGPAAATSTWRDLLANAWGEGLPPGYTPDEVVANAHGAPMMQPQAAPALPPGVSQQEGVYFRTVTTPDGQEVQVPVGEKPAEQPLYSPVDLVADVASGGLMGLAKATGRSLLGHVATAPAGAGLARLVGREAVSNGAIGLLSGGAMEATDQATGSKAGAVAAGLSAPVAAVLLPTLVRHGLMRGLQNAPGAVEKALAVTPEGASVSTKSSFLNKMGTLSENIGEEAYGALQRAEALQGLAANRVQAETGEYTLRPWVQDLLTHIPWLREDKGLAVGQRVRDLVAQVPVVGEALAGRLGISPERLQRLTTLAEVIPDHPLDAAGLLRLGIRETIKDSEGRPLEVWRHGLDPAAARDAVATLSPAEQKFLMAYVEPAQGFHLPPRLPAAGELAGPAVDPGLVATVKIMEGLDLGPAYLVSELRDSRKRWTAGLKAGGIDENLVEAAADYLKPLARLKGHDLASALEVLGQARVAAPYVKPGPAHEVLGKAVGQTPNLGNLVPDESNQGPRLAGRIGRNAGDWRPGAEQTGAVSLPFVPRGAFDQPGTISREAAFRDLVRAGVLDPEQKLSGYVTHMGTSARAKAQAAEAARLDQTAPEVALQPMVPGFAKERLDKLGEAPRLDQAVTAYRTAAETATTQREMLRKIGPLLLDKVPDETRNIGGELVKVPGNPPARSLVRTRTEPSHFAGKEVTRQEPLSLVDIGPVEAEALGVEPRRFTIPTYFAERFDSLVGRIKSGQLDTPLTGLGELTRDLARYWKLNQLVAPGTAVTNLLGGLTQYASKVGEDVVRFGLRQPGYSGRRVLDDLTAPVQALRPSMVERLPAEVLGSNVSTQFGREASQFYKGVQARLEAGEQVGLPSRALGALANLTMKTVSLGLKPFGAIENYMKRAIYLSEVMDLARQEARTLQAKGVEVKPLDLVARMFQEQPELHRKVMQGAMDRFGYDYDNIPTWLKNFRESTTGAMTVPFPVYGYKYARSVLNQANALNPLNHDLPMSERLARGVGGLLLPVTAWEAGRRYLAGGESQVQKDLDKFQEQYGTAVDGNGSHVKVPYPKLDGREMIAQGPDAQGRPQEVFLRTAKYGYLNLPKAFHSLEDFKGFLDEFKTTGPAVTLAGNLLEMDPRQGPRDIPGQVGQIVAGLIPAHRLLEFTASVSDDFRRRVPQGFWEQVMMAFPGGRDYIRQPMDKWAAKLAQDDASVEWLKFLSGINLKVVDKADAKEALAEAVARAAEHNIKDSERLAVYSRLSGLTPDEIKPHLPTIRKMETTAETNYRQIERTVFGAALLHGLDAFDPAQAHAIGKIKEKVGHEVVTQGLGMRNQHQALKGLRFAAGAAWINQNLRKGQNDGTARD